MAERIAVFGAGYAGLVTGVGLADLGHEVVVRDVAPEKIEALRAGRVPFHEPGLEEVIARAGDRLRFTLDPHEAVAGARFVFVCVGTPADLLRRRGPVGGLDGAGRAARPRGRRRRGHEEHRSRRHRRQGARSARRARADAHRLRVEPRVPRRGHGGQGLPGARPDRDRVVPGRGRRRGRAAARGARRADRAHGRPVGRDGQARGERLPGDAHLVHQRDRERVRARRRRRREGGVGDGPRLADRHPLPAGRDRLRGLLFP